MHFTPMPGHCHLKVAVDDGFWNPEVISHARLHKELLSCYELCFVVLNAHFKQNSEIYWYENLLIFR